MLNYDLTALIAVADPDPQISGGGGGWGGVWGGSVTRQRDKGVPGLKRNHPLWPQFDLWGEPRPLPWIRH